MILSASDVALAESDPFGLWHDHYGDEDLREPVDDLANFLGSRGSGLSKSSLGNATNRLQI